MAVSCQLLILVQNSIQNVQFLLAERLIVHRLRAEHAAATIMTFLLGALLHVDGLLLLCFCCPGLFCSMDILPAAALLFFPS